MKLFTKHKQTDFKNKLIMTKGETWWGGIKLEAWD